MIEHVGDAILEHDSSLQLPEHVQAARPLHTKLQQPDHRLDDQGQRNVRGSKREPTGFPHFFSWTREESVVREVRMDNPPILVR